MEVKPKIELSLSDPGMTMLHRAGVAGLYMTLKALEKHYPTLKSRQGNFKWVLASKNISLFWQGDDYTALDWLISESFKICDRGLISLTGLKPHNMPWAARLATHIGIKNTFLQHGQYFTKLDDATESLTIDGLEVALEYPKAKYYQHQKFASKLCDKNGQLLTKPIGIKGWLYPGAAVKHYAFEKSTRFTETNERAFALLFAPVACLYSIVTKSYLYETKARYSLVVPDIYDLKLYAQLRQKFNSQNFKQFYTSSYSDAALRFFIHQNTLKLLRQNNLKRCQVIVFGQAPWSKMQKSRLNVTVIEASAKALRDYQLCDRYFNNRVVEWEEGNFIASSIVRQLITENLARGLPWWHNFALAVRNRKLPLFCQSPKTLAISRFCNHYPSSDREVFSP